MRLFWKAYLGVAVVIAVPITLGTWVAADAFSEIRKASLITEARILVQALAGEIETGHAKGQWPFESLNRFTSGKNILSWWVVRPDGRIHLASDSRFMGSAASDYYPAEATTLGERRAIVDWVRRYTLLTTPLRIVPSRWSLWVFVDLRSAVRATRQITVGAIALTLLVLGVVGAVLREVLRKALGPLRDLHEGATRLAAGALAHRVPVRARDELGELAESFNRMSASLESTTVSRDYVDSIVASVDSALMVFSRSGSILRANERACDITGRSGETIVGEPWSELFDEALSAGIQEVAAGTRSVLRREGVIRAPEGKSVPVYVCCSAVRGRDDRPELALVCVAHDLRDQKRLEEERRRLQEELFQKQKMASLGTLVAGLSHELNNPLGIILGYAQSLVKRTPQDAPSRPALVAIEKQATRSAGLVRALLDFSRGKPAERQLVSPDSLLRQVTELSKGQAQRREVELQVEAAQEALPAVDVCAQEIASALLNILGNALDATAAGGRVVLRAGPASREDRAGVELSVADTGCGIAPEVLPHIFDPFFTTKPVGQGTGLGLALSRQFAEANGGDVSVESTPGQGTTMRLWLPSAAVPRAGALA